MSGCTRNGVILVISATWVKMATILWGEPSFEKTRKAKILLYQSIEEIKSSELTLQNELKGIADKVRQVGDRKKNVVTVTNLVRRSRNVRQQLAVLEKKKQALEIHVDALVSSELNQTVVKSVKETSSALKSMGLGDIHDQTNEITLDMEENIQDIQSIQKLLSGVTPDADDIEWDDVESELDNLLSGSEVAMPVSANTMSAKQTTQLTTPLPRTENLPLKTEEEPTAPDTRPNNEQQELVNQVEKREEASSDESVLVAT